MCQTIDIMKHTFQANITILRVQEFDERLWVWVDTNATDLRRCSCRQSSLNRQRLRHKSRGNETSVRGTLFCATIRRVSELPAQAAITWRGVPSCIWEWRPSIRLTLNCLTHTNLRYYKKMGRIRLKKFGCISNNSVS